MKNKNILNSSFYNVLRYGYYFLSTNLLFLLSNSFFFIAFLSVPFLIENILIYAISLIPAGPALTALFFSMGSLIRQKSLSPTKDFFRSYKTNFLISLKFWLIQIIANVIFIVDFIYFYSKGNTIVGTVFVAAFILLNVFTIVGFPMIATFEVTLANLYRSIVVIIWRYFKKQLGNVLTVGAFVIVFYAFPSEMFLFLFSLIAFYIMRTNQSMFDELAEQFSQEKKFNERGKKYESN